MYGGAGVKKCWFKASLDGYIKDRIEEILGVIYL